MMFNMFFPNSVYALGFQSLIRAVYPQVLPEPRPVVAADSYSDPYGVNKLLGGKHSFLKADYHYT